LLQTWQRINETSHTCCMSDHLGFSIDAIVSKNNFYCFCAGNLWWHFDSAVNLVLSISFRYAPFIFKHNFYLVIPFLFLWSAGYALQQNGGLHKKIPQYDKTDAFWRDGWFFDFLYILSNFRSKTFLKNRILNFWLTSLLLHLKNLRATYYMFRFWIVLGPCNSR